MPRGRFRDLTGKRFGRLLVIKRAPNKNRHVYWKCRCDCGNVVIVRGDALTRGSTVSCGCYHKDAVTKHGMYNTPIYAIWSSMLQRCENPNATGHDNYGDRNIKVCKRWHKFENFYDDMGDRPSEEHTLDRIDNDGDYEPGNCRWATWEQQGRNRRDNKILKYKGKERCVSEWTKITGIGDSTLRMRLQRGWTTAEALTIPVDLGNRWKRQKS